MLFVSDIYTVPPDNFFTDLQQQVYTVLSRLHIPFKRVRTAEAITMEDCAAINARLDMDMVKTLFLCNRQKTSFYLFITIGDKPFQARAFSAALHIPRVSFAPAEYMDTLLGTKIGAATVFSALRTECQDVQLIFDNAVCQHPWYGCSDGTTTNYLKLRTHDILTVFLPFTGHQPTIITI